MKDECLICKAPLLYLDPAEKAGIISQGQSSLSIRWGTDSGNLEKETIKTAETTRESQETDMLPIW